MLARRLARHGLSVSVGGLVAALAEGAATAAPLPSSAVTVAVRAASGQAPALTGSVEILVKGAMKTMLLTKVKWAVGAVMVAAALGASGLVYRASGQSAPPEKKPLSEVEALRRENELLKLNLEVVLEKVRAQEAELRALRAGKAQAERGKKPEPDADYAKLLQLARLSRDDSRLLPSELARLDNTLSALRSELSMWEERAEWSKRMSQPGRRYVTQSQAEADRARALSARVAVWNAETRLEMAKVLQEAEAALKSLNDARDREAQERAANELRKALKKLRTQLQKQESSPVKPEK